MVFRHHLKASAFKKYFFATALILTSVSPIHAQTPNAVGKNPPETKKGQINRIEEELSREKELYIKFGEREMKLLSQLSDLEKAIAEKRTFLRDLRERISQTKKELQRQEERLNELEVSLQEVEERLGFRLVAFYKYAKRGYVQILATSTGLHDLRRRIKYLQMVLVEDQQLIDRMGQINRQHGEEISGKREKLDSIDRLEQEERDRLASLQEDLDQKVLLLMKVHKEKEFYETAVKELELAAENLGETLSNIEKRPEKKNRIHRLPVDFNKSRGHLPLPFPGRIIRDYKPLGAKGLDTYKGVYIEGSPGGEVRAVYPGRVDFSGWLRGYGQIIVINHGSRYFTISAHLSRRDKEEGEMVAVGEPIGLLGDRESLAGPRLYFEIRSGGKNLDPLKWLKVH